MGPSSSGTASAAPPSTCNNHSFVATVLLVLTLQCVIVVLTRYGDGPRELLCGTGGAGAGENVKKMFVGGDTLALSSEETAAEQKQQKQPEGIRGGGSGEQQPSALVPQPKSLPVVFEGIKARAYNPWPENRTLPCPPLEPDWINKAQQRPTDDGLIFVKTFKTGSSTASGIALRIARNLARRQNKDYDMCKSRFDHAWASGRYTNRDPRRSWLWTIVREPTNRVVSQWFHFVVSRKKVEPSDANFRNYIEDGPREMTDDYYLGFLSLQGYKRGQDNPVDVANAIIAQYNFIAVTERMDESVVAMAMLMGVPVADILYLAAKGHGGFDDAGGRSGDVCTYIWPSFVSEGMQQILDGNIWQTKVHWDRAFYEAANRSLDLTIERLDQVKFQTNLALYERARELSRERCLERTVFPCSAGGVFTPKNRTNCIWNDSGCGSECLDEVADELNLWET